MAGRFASLPTVCVTVQSVHSQSPTVSHLAQEMIELLITGRSGATNSARCGTAWHLVALRLAAELLCYTRCSFAPVSVTSLLTIP